MPLHIWIPGLGLDQLGLVHPEHFRLLGLFEGCLCCGVFGCCFPLDGEVERGFVVVVVLGHGLVVVHRCG